MNERLRRFDWILMAAVILLLTFSVAVIYATTFAGSGGATDAIQQALFGLVGLGIVFVFGVSDYRAFRRVAGGLYAAAIGSLLLVKVIGTTALGATRWINLGFFQFQPSEFTKIVMVIVLAKIFADHQKELGAPRTFLVSLAYTIVPVLLVASQPDLGTALVIMATWLGMAIAAGIPKRFFAGIGGAAVMALLHNEFKWKNTNMELAMWAIIGGTLMGIGSRLGLGCNVGAFFVRVSQGDVSGWLFGAGMIAGAYPGVKFFNWWTERRMAKQLAACGL